VYTCEYLYVSNLNWIYTKPGQQERPQCGKIQSFFEKFKPNVWAKYNWDAFSNLNRYFSIIFYCTFVLAVDCNNFFLKFILWIPPENKLLQVRIALWAFSAIAATKEFYEFTTN